jgi:nucleoid DNA-binding protein
MEELIDEIVARTGLPRDQAAVVARATVEFITDRLSAEEAVEVNEALAEAATARTSTLR